MDQLPPGVDLSKIPLSPPPKGLVSNFINPPSLAPVAEVVGGLLIAIETILVLLRTCTNWKSFGKLRLEDCMWKAFIWVDTSRCAHTYRIQIGRSGRPSSHMDILP